MTAATPCRACADADASPLTGSYRSACLECNLRALAHSPSHFESATAGRLSPAYVRALDLLLADGDGDGIAEPEPASRDALHARVKGWAARIAGARRG